MSKEKNPLKQVAGHFQSVMDAVADGLKERGICGFEAISKLAQPSGKKTIKKIVDDIAELCAEIVQGISNKFLKLISQDESLVLNPTDGTETLANANDTFSYIDPDFNNWGVDEKGPATKETHVQVYEMVENATFSELFGSLSSDVRKLCLTQSQIKNFVKKYKNWLRTDGYGTFFLFESNGDFFVADVDVDSVGGLLVYVRRFGNSDVWYAGLRLRGVVPQLA